MYAGGREIFPGVPSASAPPRARAERVCLEAAASIRPGGRSEPTRDPGMNAGAEGTPSKARLPAGSIRHMLRHVALSGARRTAERMDPAAGGISRTAFCPGIHAGVR